MFLKASAGYVWGTVSIRVSKIFRDGLFSYSACKIFLYSLTRSPGYYLF
jgi:hypothetical protein